MTLELLEKYVKSEVENLHLRVDQLTAYVEKIDERLSRVERQLTLLINSVEDLNVRVANIENYIENNLVTKSELKVELEKHAEYIKTSILNEIKAYFQTIFNQPAPR